MLLVLFPAQGLSLILCVPPFYLALRVLCLCTPILVRPQAALLPLPPRRSAAAAASAVCVLCHWRAGGT